MAADFGMKGMRTEKVACGLDIKDSALALWEATTSHNMCFFRAAFQLRLLFVCWLAAARRQPHLQLVSAKVKRATIIIYEYYVNIFNNCT